MFWSWYERNEMKHVPLLILLPLLLCGLAACKQYTPAPIDWEKDATFGTPCEVTLGSPEDAVLLALIGNREINRLRLSAAMKENIAKESGWWEDPAFEFDLKRILDPSDHPFLGGGALVFTIPLSGVPEREIKVAEAFTDTAKAEVLAAEHALGIEVRKAFYELLALRERIHVLEQMEDAALCHARDAVLALYSAGEVSLAERMAMEQSFHTRSHTLTEARTALRTAEHDLLQLLGLHPEVTLRFTATLPSPQAPLPEVEVQTLLKHPEVLLALARLGESEAQLELEVRRQYPDLNIGPVYANEEGLNRLGLTAGITLPLWNRNRKAIAEAEGERTLTRLSAIQCWQTLVCDATKVRAAYQQCLPHAPAPLQDRQALDQLFTLVELTPLDYLALRETLLEQTLLDLARHQQLALLTADFTNFTL
jgi:hypothetical protein